VGVKLGIRTDTLDITGSVIEEKPINCDPEAVRMTALSFTGEKNLPVPIYSAIKVQGQKLYEYARNQEDVTIPHKIMKFWQVKEVSGSGSEWVFDLSCSKGSYIRTWVDEVGKILQCGAVMSSLVRTWSDPYPLSQAMTIEEIESAVSEKREIHSQIDIEHALPKVKKIRIKGMDQKLLLNGQISHDLRVQLIQIFDPLKDQIIQILSQDSGRLIALLGLDPGKGFAIRRVLNS
jgi:tRNA pseudouridine55 synthase